MRVLVNVDVPSVDRGVAFYVTALGMRFVRLLFEGTVAELAAGDTVVFLLAQPEGSRAIACAAPSAVRVYGRHWTPVHIDVVVEDLEAALAAAVAGGARLEAGPHDAVWGRHAVLADPFGHGVCLVQPGPRGYDPVAS